jgi:26S proteasome regulatory subunit T2
MVYYELSPSVVLGHGLPRVYSHAIVSSSVGPEYYVSILSFVDKSQLEPGCSLLLHNKVLAIVGTLADDTDPLVSVMKVRTIAIYSTHL